MKMNSFISFNFGFVFLFYFIFYSLKSGYQIDVGFFYSISADFYRYCYCVFVVFFVCFLFTQLKNRKFSIVTATISTSCGRQLRFSLDIFLFFAYYEVYETYVYIQTYIQVYYIFISFKTTIKTVAI